MPDLEASAISSVRRDIDDILHSGQYYVTPELTRELTSIENGLKDMIVDKNLLNSSSAWRSAQSASPRIGNVNHSLGDAQNVLCNVKAQLDGKTVSQMQANQIRATHHKSMQDLINLREQLRDHTHSAKESIDRFSDHIGVTDRFTGYRSNLTRSSRDPFRLDSYWIRELNNQKVKFDETGINRGLSIPQRSSFSQYQTSRRAASLRSPTKVQFQTQPSMERAKTTPATFRPQPTQSIQEACGINMVFPGSTEYMTRYVHPPPMDLQGKSGFTINPAPDYMIYGRPIARKVYERANTEYQYRYEWPDGNKIMKLPWLRK